MARPDFETFRELFLSCLAEHTGQEPSALAEKNWSEIGSREVRYGMLEAVKEKLREKYGVEFEANQRLVMIEGPVESAVIQAFHELSTICLMERINAKIRARMN
ncbi:MAG: hypothetical protein HPY89_01645 [Pelotomaculum sp.]|uniref:Uncharacterized protein n=1 Tax=Pelotomaculum thermopropionicum (strain DSM 13744 / JCM 10971 / SI) TaxID=370438 RepID=A5D0M3_PELTS|nr:hypothetical protein [Pelotomaculum sp.]BAF60228.1 hypothetical protein PTH_2047 [Pelotomaculum thermopropionicum SI]